jgi:predicted acyltransferase
MTNREGVPNGVQVPATGRLSYLDQFRGYTVAGMILVNGLGRFNDVHAIFKHHNTYCSYADTIMSQFFFAVGFAMRLSLGRRIAREGARAAYRHAIGRGLGLLALGVVFHGLGSVGSSWEEARASGLVPALIRAFQKEPFQALTHIACASLWCLPVIGARAVWLGVFGMISSGLYLYACARGYYDFAWNLPVIDGGPLGFLTWTIPVLLGALCHEMVARLGSLKAMGPILAAAVLAMAGGYLLSGIGLEGGKGWGWAEAPFWPPGAGHAPRMWMMSQRTGSLSYQLFGAGWAAAVLVVAIGLSERMRIDVPIFRTLGSNALVAYLLHGMVLEGLSGLAPNDVPGWFAFVVVFGAIGATWILVRALERRGVYLRL